MTPTVVLVVSAFLASAVEMVEALTIVLALGVTRGWRSVTIGAAASMPNEGAGAAAVWFPARSTSVAMMSLIPASLSTSVPHSPGDKLSGGSYCTVTEPCSGSRPRVHHK